MKKASKLKAFLFGVCACVNLGIPLTLLMSLNALFTDWLTYFQADRGTTSAVQATGFGVTLGAGLIAGMLERKLGERRSLLLGSFLSALGLFCGSYAPSLPVLILCVGVVAGSGFCLLHLSSISTALRRFPDKSGFMSSIMSATAGLFHLSTPLLYRFLSEEYTWRGSLLFASAIALHSFAVGLLLTSPLLRPTPALSISPSLGNDTTPCATGNLQSEDRNQTAGPLSQGNRGSKTSADDDDDVYHSQNVMQRDLDSDHIAPEDSSIAQDFNTERELVLIADPSRNDAGETRVSFLKKPESDLPGGAGTDATETDPHDLPLLRDSGDDSGTERDVFLQAGHAPDNHEDACLALQHTRREEDHHHDSQEKLHRSRWRRLKESATFLTSPLYLCVLVHTVVVLSTIFCFLLLVLDYSIHRGWSVQDGVLLNFVFMLSGLISRVLVGVVSLHARVSSMALMIGGGVIGSAGLCFVGQVRDFAAAAAFYACMAVGYGVTVGMFPSVVLDVTGPREYPVALGLTCTVEGVFDTLMGIFTGVLVDLLQSYSMLSLVYGVVSLASSVVLLIVYRCCR